jgi:hypothetical protein
MSIEIETAVRIVVGLLVKQQYDVVESMTRGRRLKAEHLAEAVSTYGRTLVERGSDWWSTVDVTPVRVSPGTFHVAAPLWTAEEGRSDLTLEMWLIPLPIEPPVYDVEILSLHVL